MTYYDILGISKNATFEEIRRAYRAQIKFFHPDVFQENPEIAKIKTLQLNEAYSILSDAKKREVYDKSIGANTQPEQNKTGEAYRETEEHAGRDDGGNEAAQQFDRRVKITWLDLQPDWVQKAFRILKPIMGIVAIYAAIWVCSIFFSTETDQDYQNDLQANPVSADELPQNGEVLSSNTAPKVAPFTVNTEGDGYYFVKLKDVATKEDALCFFVHGGQNAEVYVPLGTYELVYAYGVEWFGEENLFGVDTSYTKADDTFEFSQDETQIYGWTIDLFFQYDGNLDTVPIDASEF